MQKSLRSLLQPKFFLALLIAIVILAFIERTIGIPSKMILFIFDSARDMLFVKKIVIDHKIILIGPSSGGLQGYYQGVIWYYLLVIPFLLGKGDPAIMTLFMGALSTISIIIVYLTIRKLTCSATALIAATIFSFATFSTATAKFIWNPYPIVWLTPVLFFSFWLFIRKSTIALPLAALLIGLMFNFEAIYGVCLVPILLGLFIWQGLREQPLRKKLGILVTSAILFILPFLPMLAFDVRHQFIISKTLLQTFHSGGSGLTHSANEKVTALPNRIIERSQDLYTYTAGSLTPNQLVNLIFFIGFLYCVFLVFRNGEKPQKQLTALTLIALLIPFFFFLTLKYAVWSYYWIGNSPLYTLLFCFIIGTGLHVSNKGTFSLNTYKSAFTMLLLFLLLFVYNPLKYLSLWQSGELQESSQVLKTQLRIVDSIYTDAHGKQFSAYVLTPPVYDYVYRYLFWWRGQGEFAGLKQDTKQQNIYLIIEPNASDPTGAYFRKNVIHTNNSPVQISHFPGNVMVQKIITSPKEQPIEQNYFPQL